MHRDSLHYTSYTWGRTAKRPQKHKNDIVYTLCAQIEGCEVNNKKENYEKPKNLQ